jgi:microsomal dipeptidase-like Zn-dependent dipeptidase
VGGIDCVGIGADHFPYNSKPAVKPFLQSGSTQIEDRDWRKTFVVGLDNISALPLFTQGLVSRCFADRDVKKILGLNVLRVLKDVWKA